jgi:hypothetical protein
VRRFLQALQGGVLPDGIISELVTRIGKPAFGALIAEGVLVRGDRATTYPCPGGGSECPRDVVENPGDPEFPFVAVPPGPEICCPSVRLTEADLETKRTSRSALVKLISRLFRVDGPANLDTAIFRHAHRLGRSRWGGIERDVLLCTNLSGSEAVGHLLARKAMRQPTLILAHARTRYTSPEIAAHFGRGEVVEVAFLEDCLAIEDGRVVTREPAVLGVAEPVATYALQPELFCVVIDQDGRREVDEATYRDVAARMMSCDLFLDLLSTVRAGRYRSGYSDEHRAFVETSLTPQQAWAYAELVEKRKPTRAGELATLSDFGASHKQVEAARRAVDLKLSRKKWRSTELIAGVDASANRYLFKPPPGLRFVVIRPLTSPS